MNREEFMDSIAEQFDSLMERDRSLLSYFIENFDDEGEVDEVFKAMLTDALGCVGDVYNEYSLKDHLRDVLDSCLDYHS